MNTARSLAQILTNYVVTFGLVGLPVLGLAFGYSAPAKADIEDDLRGLNLGEAFKPGSSCAGLAYLSEGQLRESMGSTFAAEFNNYCYPEEPFDCTDYSSFLKGLAQLSTGSDGYYCQLHPQL